MRSCGQPCASYQRSGLEMFVVKCDTNYVKHDTIRTGVSYFDQSDIRKIRSINRYSVFSSPILSKQYSPQWFSPAERGSVARGPPVHAERGTAMHLHAEDMKQ